MPTLRVERWTLQGTEDVELTSDEALEGFLDTLPVGTVFVLRPCAGHAHCLVLTCPMEEALYRSDVTQMFEAFGAKVGLRRQPMGDLSDFDLDTPGEGT